MASMNAYTQEVAGGYPALVAGQIYRRLSGSGYFNHLVRFLGASPLHASPAHLQYVFQKVNADGTPTVPPYTFNDVPTLMPDPSVRFFTIPGNNDPANYTGENDPGAVNYGGNVFAANNGPEPTGPSNKRRRRATRRSSRRLARSRRARRAYRK